MSHILLSPYFLVNYALVLAYPVLRVFTSAGDRSLRQEDPFGFTYENSIIYTVLILIFVAYSRSASFGEFVADGLIAAKVGVASLLFFAKVIYSLYYVIACLILWLIVPYPVNQGESKFIKIRSVEEFEKLVGKGDGSKGKKVEKEEEAGEKK